MIVTIRSSDPLAMQGSCSGWETYGQHIHWTETGSDVERDEASHPVKWSGSIYHPKVLLHSKVIRIFFCSCTIATIKRATMRIAFISDIHGNFTALQAVLADIKSQHVDQIVCLGDTVTLGPQPNEVLSKLRELNCVLIKGNHDAALLDPEEAEKYEITEHLIADLYWCRDQLTQADLNFIGAFKSTHEIDLPNGVTILCFHGSPFSTTDIIQATTPAELLDKYFEGQRATVFIGGHSHIQMYRRHGDKLILNSGSVGNTFMFAYSPGDTPRLLPWAEYTIISQNENYLDVDLRRVYFDTVELLKLVTESGLPGTDWWLRQYSK
jgi:putative phosphoesterase